MAGILLLLDLFSPGCGHQRQGIQFGGHGSQALQRDHLRLQRGKMKI